MAKQTKTYTQACDNGYSLILSVTEESTSTPNNTSALSWILKLKSTYAGFDTFRIGWSVSINGEIASSKAWSSATYRSLSKNSEITIISSDDTDGGGNVTVTHNSDGTKSVSVSATMEISKASYSPVNGSSGTGTKTVSGIMSLTTIPRASTLTIPTLTAGKEATFTINRASSSFTHRIEYKFSDDASWAYITDQGGSSPTSETSIKWTPPLSLLYEMTNSLTRTYANGLWLETLSNGVRVGAQYYDLTINADSNAKPSVASFTISDPNSVTLSGTEYHLQGKAQINFNIVGTGYYDSTITNYEFQGNGETLNPSNGEGSTQVIADVPSNPTTLTLKGWVKDSRGRWSTASTKTITVYKYNSPKILSCNVYRCTANGTADTSGEYLRLYCSASLGDDSSVNGKNSIEISYSTSRGDNGRLTSGTALVIGGSYEVDQTYVVTVTVADTVGTSIVRTFNIPTELVTMHMKEGGKAVAFSTYATKDNTVDFGTWSPIGYVLGLGVAKETLQGVDFNNIVSPGVYGFLQNTDAASSTNRPSTLAGTLRVWTANGAEADSTTTYHYVIQEYIDIHANLYMRRGYSTTTPGQYTWLGWYKPVWEQA